MTYTPAYMLPDKFRDGWVIALVERDPQPRKYGFSNEPLKVGQMALIVENSKGWPYYDNYVRVKYYAEHATHSAWIKRTDVRRPTDDEVMAVSYGEYVAIHGRIG